jgi:hypothetical protein
VGQTVSAKRSGFAIFIFSMLLESCATVVPTNEGMPAFVVSIASANWEVNYVWSLLEKIEYYERNIYALNLPECVYPVLLEKARKKELTGSDRNRFREDFTAQVYNKLDYMKGYEAVAGVLGIANNRAAVFREYHEQWGFYLPQRYDVRLTLYGPGGSFDRETGTIIMLTTREGNFKRGKDPLETMLHESVHMGTEAQIVLSYGLSHWTTERVVDKFIIAHFSDLCPQYRIQPNVETGIDIILEDKEVWDNLPERIAQHVLRSKR